MNILIKKTIFCFLLTVFLFSNVYADFIPPPPPLQKLPVELQQYLRTISDNFNNLDVVTTTPNGNRYGKIGDLIIYNNSGTFELFVNTTGTETTPTTVWQQI